MANKNAPAGGRIVNSIISADFNPSIHEYVIPASDSTAYYANDFVKTNFTSEDGKPIAIKANAGDVLRGIITTFKAEREEDDITYRAPNTRRIAYVCDDPWVEFEMQINGAITESDIGKDADLLVATGSAGSPVSNTQLDFSTLTMGFAQVKVLGIIDKPQNELGSFVKLRCMISEHELNESASHGSFGNLSISGNTISSTNTNGPINLSPNGIGKVTVSTDLDVNNINIDGNTVSSTDTDGDINLSPNGTGTVAINTDLDVDNININGNTISSTNTDGNIVITPDGNGITTSSKQFNIDNCEIKHNISIINNSSGYDSKQMAEFSHDNVFDAYDCSTADGITFQSSSANSNYVIQKDTSDLKVRVATGVAQGSPISAFTDSLNIDTSGFVTVPVQPFFRAKRSADIPSFLGGSAVKTIIFDTEVVDRNDDYENTDGIFTAPVDGIYEFSTGILTADIVASNDNAYVSILTSNERFPSNIMSPFAVRVNPGVDNQWSSCISVVTEMEAGDTAQVQCFIDGTATVRLKGSDATWFSGVLIC